MTDRELVQQALDAFKGLLVFNPSPAEYKQGRDVVAALRDRLAQPEQELVIDCPRCGHCCPQRPWVGLTDEEIDALHMAVKVRLMGTFDIKDIYRSVEEKLKEKNT